MKQNVEIVNLTFICRLWFYSSSWPLTQEKLLNNDQSVDEDEGNYNEMKKGPLIDCSETLKCSHISHLFHL